MVAQESRSREVEKYLWLMSLLAHNPHLTGAKVKYFRKKIKGRKYAITRSELGSFSIYLADNWEDRISHILGFYKGELVLGGTFLLDDEGVCAINWRVFKYIPGKWEKELERLGELYLGSEFYQLTKESTGELVEK